MISRKRLILVSVLIILLVVTGLYATYAINVFEEETTPTEYDMAFNFDLSGSVTREMTIPAGKTKVFDFDITNPYNDTVQYGVAYSLVSPTTLPSGVTIAESSLSKNSAVGQINANSTISTSIIVVNESSSSITLSFSVVNGYKNGGDLIVPTGKTLVKGSYHVGPPLPASLATLTNLGLTELLQEGTPNFSAEPTIDEGIYAAEDDLGTSYYFRGSSTHNYVLFDNIYWRIVRINGDGTVRMIYDGTSAHEDGDGALDRYVVWKEFNANYDDNAYVGYMYGTPGASTYSATHENKIDSAIKAYLEDTWYPTISEKNKEYIADAIYCNDRSLYSGTGVGDTETEYGAYGRQIGTSKNPILTCKRKEDRFTLESTNFDIETNGMLDAPVGLITIDEVVMVGLPSYLSISEIYWTMSPSQFFGGDALVFDVQGVYYSPNSVESIPGSARPVISLKADALKYDASTSNGTMQHPFVIAS